MRLKEFEGKEIFKKYGIAVPKGVLVKSLKDLNKVPFDECVVKAQVLSGKRGKSGLIKIVDKEKLKTEVSSMLKKNIGSVLVEEKIKFDKESYLSLSLDTFEKKIICLFSEEGGIDIESLAKNKSKIVKFFIDDKDSIRKGLTKYPNVAEMAAILYKIMIELDAELVEINPLATVGNKMVALDSKIILDDNALFRHKEFEKLKLEQLDEFERKAWDAELHFVDLDGDVGIVGVGAGLVMATMDLVNFNGMKPAFFLDAGGGASLERMMVAMNIIDKRKPKKVFFNIFGGITRCDEIATAIVDYKKKHGLKIPIVVRIIGTNEKEAKKILKENSINCVDSVEDAMKKLKVI